ncbi:MAG: peroxiredoxin-like family protein [Thioalkalispiraceae bacterium]
MKIYQYTLHKMLLILVGLVIVVSACTPEEPVVPSIKERVEAFNKSMMKKKDRPQLTETDQAIMQKAADDLGKTLPAPGLKVGETAPDFTLGNANGKPVSLSSKLNQGPVVLIFYRGAWCPYCNIQLHALHESLPAFRQYGAQLVAVTPQKPDKSLQQVNKDKYPFEILSDLDYQVAKAYRLYFEVPGELHELYKQKFGLDIEEFNGEGRLGLPVPGTFVIDSDGKIVAVHAELDYKQRMEPKAILAALKAIKN